MSKINAFSHLRITIGYPKRIDSWKNARQVAADLRLWAECDQSHEDPGHVLIARHLLSEMANSLDRALDHMEVQASRACDKKSDELNAAISGGECEWTLGHSGTLYDKWKCSACGYLYVESRTDGGATDFDPNYCPHCGFKIRKAVKR